MTPSATHEPSEGLALAAAAGGAPFVAPVPGAAALEVTGPDAVDFLHGQLANDVRGLRPGETVRSLLLNHKGHALAEAQVLRLEERRLLLVVDDGLAGWVRETLERHVVFDEVAIGPARAAVVTVQGTRAGAAVAAALGAAALPDDPRSVLAAGGLLSYRVARSAAGGWDLVALGEGAETAEAALLAAGAVVVGPEGLAAARVAAGVPAAGWEGGEGVLPQEAGLARYVSFRKGCYLGQEIMARVEARGAVRRGLRLLELAGEPDGRDVTVDGRAVGRLGTVARAPDGALRALAVVRLDLPDGAEVSVGGTAGRVVGDPARIMHP